MKIITFYTLFPEYEDFHFWKDPGQIPFRFSKLGYSSKIICRKNGDYTETSKYLEIEYIPEKKVFGKDIGLIYYLITTSKSIDILNVFHIHSWESLLAAFIYKSFNPRGFVYLKMDNCHNSGIYNWEKIFDNKLVPASFSAVPKETLNWKIKSYLIKYLLIKKIDLFSVEDDESKYYFENKYSFFKNKLIVAYNGHTMDLVSIDYKFKSYEEKENLIITVGRLGTYQKNTYNLLEGFASTANQHNWKLNLAGNIDPAFNNDIAKFFFKYPELKVRIRFLGNLKKPELYDLYNSSKIFLLPSRFETFALVYAEAMYFGNAIVTTPYTSIKKIVKEKQLGLLIDPEKPAEIGEAILELVNNSDKLKQMELNAKKFAEENLSWDIIVNNIDKEFKKRI